MKDSVLAGWSSHLLSWYDSYKRDFPWRRDPQPYHTWVCEVMSQQTTMAVVVPRFVEFVRALPRLEDLAVCDEATLRTLWAGLGYYARARNLRKGAEYVVHERGGVFPSSYEEWLRVPGVGPYTASVIASITGGEPVACVDGNVIRVASRMLALSETKSVWSTEGQRRIQAFVQGELSAFVKARARPGDFNQALMELGATVCTKASPSCLHCPIQRSCRALAVGVVDACPPVKPRKESTALDLLAVCLVRFEGGEPTHAALAERGKGFLKGTLGLPLVDERHFPGDASLSAIAARVGAPVAASRTFSHGITHHAITGRACVARVGAAEADARARTLGSFGASAPRWVALDDVEASLASSLDRKAWGAARALLACGAAPSVKTSDTGGGASKAP